MSGERPDQEPFEEAPIVDAGLVRRHARRLEDKLLIAFHQACDVNDLEVADEMLRVLEMMLNRRPIAGDSARRRNMESLVAAHQRLWQIRHQGM